MFDSIYRLIILCLVIWLAVGCIRLVRLPGQIHRDEAAVAARWRRRLGIALAAMLAIIVVLAVLPFLPAIPEFLGGSPDLPASSGRSIRLEIGRWHDTKRTVTSFDVEEPNCVDAILGVLRRGVQHSDHKCASVGTAAITFADGQAVTIEILPGHTAENYEFRYQGRNYFVPRDAFLTALRKAGIDTALLSAPR